MMVRRKHAQEPCWQCCCQHTLCCGVSIFFKSVSIAGLRGKHFGSRLRCTMVRCRASASSLHLKCQHGYEACEAFHRLSVCWRRRCWRDPDLGEAQLKGAKATQNNKTRRVFCAWIAHSSSCSTAACDNVDVAPSVPDSETRSERTCSAKKARKSSTRQRVRCGFQRLHTCVFSESSIYRDIMFFGL